MEVAFTIGIDPITFWQITPIELGIAVTAFNKKRELENEQNIVNAYLSAYWHRIKKMPSLKEVLGKKPSSKLQSPEEMLNIVKALNEAFGGTVKGG
jgi:hypothetical protein